MKRRDAIRLICGAVAASAPLAARSQGDRIRRLGILMSLADSDRESQARLEVFGKALRELGWSAGGNLRIDTRWGADDAARTRAAAAELLALAPDIVLASGNTAAKPLHQATRTVPIVFVQVAEPLGEGLVASFARPGGNVTGFASIDHGVGVKWVELLREIAPRTTRALVVRDPATAAGNGQFGAIQAAAVASGIAVSAVGVRDAGAIERAIDALAQTPGGSLIVTTSTRASAHRDVMLTLAARHKIPAVYPYRYYVDGGGLLSYGPDWTDQYRRAAGYVDRILKGEAPGDLPVQTPEKYDLTINRRAARALGLDVPAAMLARAAVVVD